MVFALRAAAEQRQRMAFEGVRAIARGTGMDRKTIAEYLRAAQAVGIQLGGPPSTDEQLTAITTARRPGRPSNAEAREPMAAGSPVSAYAPRAYDMRPGYMSGRGLY